MSISLHKFIPKIRSVVLLMCFSSYRIGILDYLEGFSVENLHKVLFVCFLSILFLH